MTAAATDLKQAPSAQPFEAGPRSDVIDDALAILRGTHDGDELDRLHLQMVELAVNAGSLAVFNERGVEVWRKLVADVRSGAYQARWFHDQENLRIDHQGYVRWRDKVVEHFSFKDLAAEQAAARKLALQCRILEARGLAPTTGSLSALWSQMDRAIGMPTPRFVVAWWMDDTMAVSKVEQLHSDSGVESVDMEAGAAVSSLGRQWCTSAPRSMLVATREYAEAARQNIRQDIAWREQAFHRLPARSALAQMAALADLPADLPTAAEVLAFYAQQAGIVTPEEDQPARERQRA